MINIESLSLVGWTIRKRLSPNLKKKKLQEEIKRDIEGLGET